MRAFVTGGTGFVGSHLVEALMRRGDEVTALVRTPGKAAKLEELGVRIVQGDLDDGAALRSAARGQEAVYHVAGLVAARGESEFLRVNHEGTLNVLRAAREASGPRFVHVSSLAAAGPASSGRPLRGDEPPRPVTAYGRSKLAGEMAVRDSGLAWSIVRPPIVYGPGDTEFLRVFKLARKGIGAVFGDGAQELSAVYAPDLAQALMAVGSADSTIGQIYYACSEERFTTHDFVRAVGRAVGRKTRIVSIPRGLVKGLLRGTGAAARLAGRATVLNADKANEFLQPAWTADASALTQATGWQAAHDLASGLAATAAWYREHGWL